MLWHLGLADLWEGYPSEGVLILRDSKLENTRIPWWFRW